MLGPPTFRVVFILAVVALLGTGCRKRTELDYQNEQLQVSLNDLRTSLRSVEAELAGVPNLGRYAATQRSHIPELKNRIQGIKDDSSRLTAERDSLKQVVAKLQKELDDYQAKFAGR